MVDYGPCDTDTFLFALMEKVSCTGCSPGNQKARSAPCRQGSEPGPARTPYQMRYTGAGHGAEDRRQRPR